MLSLPKIASAVAATVADVSVAAAVVAAVSLTVAGTASAGGNNPIRLSIDDVFDMGAISGVESSPEMEVDLLFGGCGCGCGSGCVCGLFLSKLTILLR